VNGTRKQRKKEDRNKSTKLSFKTIPTFDNTLLATTEIKFFQVLLPTVGAHQPTHQLLWAQTHILLWGNFSLWGGSQTQLLLRVYSPFWGPLGPFGVQGLKINFI
jgi:hypothetical protein